ncbi:MAG TPA: tRNA (adenosine(37)-N6)-threonylcarbamoyltransferase complex ATPase subunit type 1 TsaE [Mycoplasmatales bacterium]|jgi:tRNA threonylcarbamoyladenosine biosynthesis protein TsaE|nr:tRNA (adenosine(37)-N6)-threonylcarbamoyltransferase complex ATPase subunit type 1 TsaE [Mycoplasmatales bacterium]
MKELLLKKKFDFFSIKNLRDLEQFSINLVNVMEKGCFVAINGEIGVGKTTLVKYVCKYLGIKENVTSPTFMLMKRYWIEKLDCYLNHFDFFRISDDKESFVFNEYKNENINMIEWANFSPSFWINEKKLICLKIVVQSDDFRKIYLNSSF